MEKNNILLLAMALLILVALSGCVSTPPAGNGVVISNWETEQLREIFSREDMRMRLRVKNTGTSTAEDVEAQLYGLPDTWTIRDEEHRLNDLIGADPTQGVEGQEKTVYFELTAPNLALGEERTYSPAVRVYYTYKTTATVPVSLVGKNEWIRRADSGSLPDIGQVSYAAGPLSVDATARNVRVSENRIKFPINIYIRNMGNGVVIEEGRRDATEEANYLVDVKIDEPSELNLDCGINGGNSGEITLWQGNDYTITCEVEVREDRIITMPAEIKIELGYDYYIDASSTIRVIGQER